MLQPYISVEVIQLESFEVWMVCIIITLVLTPLNKYYREKSVISYITEGYQQ